VTQTFGCYCRTKKPCPIHGARAFTVPAARLSAARPPLTSVPPADGPGSELKRLLTELGLTGKAGCGCEAFLLQMNAWGLDGCAQHREAILAQLRVNQARLGWLEALRAAAAAVRSGLVLALNPLDPAPGLLDEALRRWSINR